MYTGKVMVRGTIAKRIDFYLRVPFAMVQVAPWWNKPPDDPWMEEAFGQGLITHIRELTGARMTIPRYPAEGPRTVVIRGKTLDEEWRALWACSLIVNAASKHNGLAALSIEVRVNQTIDDEEAIRQPQSVPRPYESWPQTCYKVTGNLYATGPGPGVHYDNDPVLIGNDAATTRQQRLDENDPTVRTELDYVAYRSELPNGRGPTSLVDAAVQHVKEVVYRKSEGTQSLRAHAWRVGDGIIVSGAREDAKQVYIKIRQELFDAERRHAFNRASMHPLPTPPLPINPVAPFAELQNSVVSYPSELMTPAR